MEIDGIPGMEKIYNIPAGIPETEHIIVKSHTETGL